MAGRDSKGRFTSGGGGGGGGGQVAGLTAAFAVDTSGLPGDVAQIDAAMDQIAAKVSATAGETKKLDASLKQAGSGGSALASRLMVMGQFADDAQYGFRAIVNQIPQVVTAFGGSMGLAGGIALAGVAINQLMNHWDDLTALFEEPVVVSAAEQMDALAKATSRTTEETIRLNRHKREQSTIEAQAARRPKQEGVIAGEVGKAIGEAGADELLSKIRLKMLSGMGEITEEAITARVINQGGIKVLAGGGSDEELRKAREKAISSIQADRLKVATEESTKLLANAETGPGQLGIDARKRVGEMLPGPEGQIFRTPLAEVEAKKQQEVAKRNVEAENKLKEMLDRADKENKEKALKAQDDAARKNTEERAANERRMDKETEAGFGRVRGMQERQEGVEEENRRKNQEFFRGVRENEKEDEQLAVLKERRNDTQYRLMNLLNQPAQGQTLGIEAYNESIHATSQDTQAKMLHEIQELRKDINRQNEKIAVLTVRRR